MIGGTEVLYNNEKYTVRFVEYYVDGQPNIWISNGDYELTFDQINNSKDFELHKVFAEDLEILTKEKHPEHYL